MIEDNREIQASTGAERSSLTTMVPGCGADPMSVSRQGARAGVSMQEVSPLGFETSKTLAQKPILLSPTICYPAAENALANLAADMLHQLIPNIDSYSLSR
ncbi:Methionyl-tRNA formyltransferase [Puccinia graminis f. sp. tritici]|nr:Methionyl-tRNA formyltransferase [Puccinia graminis f. sp. tritici]